MNLQKGNIFLIIAIIVGVIAIGAVGFASWKYFGEISELEQLKEKETQPVYSPEKEKTVPEMKEQDEITKPYIQVISPNGGEELVVGKTYNITWAFKGPSKMSVDINLYDYSHLATKQYSITVAISASAKKYSWTIPTILQGMKIASGKEYKIVVGESRTPNPPYLFDESDNYFSIEKDETADWKTYNNEKYGFEVKYPLEGKVVDGRIFPDSNFKNSPPIDIFVWENPEKITSNQWLDKRVKEYNEKPGTFYIEEKGTIFVDNIKGVKFYLHNGGVFPHTVLIGKGKLMYQIDSYRGFDALFNQILSTFKFTE